MAGVGGISGLATGLDTVEIISKMLDLERIPITNLEKKIAANLDLKSAYEMLEANLLALKIDSRTLLRRDLFKTLGASSSNEDIITATASGENRSAPSAHSRANGIIPTIVEKEVIIIGRKRVDTDSIMAARRSAPCSRCCLIKSIRMME